MTNVVWFVRGEQHAALCQVSMAAAKRADPKSVCYVVTDEADLTVPGAKMLRFEPGLPMMVANLEAQLTALWHLRTPTWFIDTDVLMLKPFPEIWDEQLVVTWRDNIGGKLNKPENDLVADVMPYNYGVMGVLPGPRTTEGFLWMRERVRRMTPHLRDWYGNQLALAALAGPRPKTGEATDLRRIPWSLTDPWPPLKVRKIPGEVWNFTPAEADEDVTERGALHFKGHARKLMPEFAKRLALNWPFAEEAA